MAMQFSLCSMGSEVATNMLIYMSRIKGCPKLSGVQCLKNYSSTLNKLHKFRLSLR